MQTGKEVQQEKAPPLGRPSASRLRLYPRSDEPRASQSRDRSARWRRTDWNMGYELKGWEAELAYMVSPDHWDVGSLGYATVIGDSANAGSIGVLSRCGFQMIGTHPDVGFKFGRWLDTVMMQRALGDGAKTLPATS